MRARPSLLNISWMAVEFPAKATAILRPAAVESKWQGNHTRKLGHALTNKPVPHPGRNLQSTLPPSLYKQARTDRKSVGERNAGKAVHKGAPTPSMCRFSTGIEANDDNDSSNFDDGLEKERFSLSLKPHLKLRLKRFGRTPALQVESQTPTDAASLKSLRLAAFRRDIAHGRLDVVGDPLLRRAGATSVRRSGIRSIVPVTQGRPRLHEVGGVLVLDVEHLLIHLRVCS